MISRFYSTKDISKRLMNFIKNTKCYERNIKQVNILSASNGKCVAEFKVIKEYQNRKKILHGGFLGLLVDMLANYCLFSCERRGVSLDISIKYLKAAKENEVVIAEAEIIKLGRTIAYLEITFRNKKTCDLIAVGTHTVFLDKKFTAID